jgi:cytochrome c biogenesis protein
MADLDTGVPVAPDADAGLDAPPRPEPVRPPRLGPVGWLRWGWRVLTSMRTALLLLFLLAVAAVPGSVLPQRGVDPSRVTEYARAHPALFPWLDRLSLFDVYSSPWFSAIYLLLFASLTGCVLPRSRQHWAALRAGPPAAPRNLARLPVARRWETSAAPAAVLAEARAALRDRRFRVVVHEDAVAAERGHLREVGNLAFHLALLLILLAVAVGHRYGFTANVVVAEGKGFSNSVLQYDDFSAGSNFDAAQLTPFGVTLERLDVRYQEEGMQQGAPRDFTANVRYRENPDTAAQRAQIRPNSPLVFGGTKVFLLGNGYAPRFTVRDGVGTVVLQGPVPLLPRRGAAGMLSAGALKVPDAVPEPLGLNLTFLPTFVRAPVAGPVSVFPDARNPRVFVTDAWKGDLGPNRNVYRLDTAGLTRLQAGGEPLTAELAPGDSLTLPDGLGTVTFDGVSRFANFQVARNPGATPALAAAALAIAGLMASLFVRRRRTWVRTSAGPGGTTVVEVAGLARAQHTDGEGLAAEVDRLAGRLRRVAPRSRRHTPTPPTLRSRHGRRGARPAEQQPRLLRDRGLRAGHGRVRGRSRLRCARPGRYDDGARHGAPRLAGRGDDGAAPRARAVRW